MIRVMTANWPENWAGPTRLRSREEDAVLTLKTITPKAVTAAIEKAKQYRLLNEPQEAESICMDVLAIAPDNQEALITMLLAVTDSLDADLGLSFDKAQGIIKKLGDQYCQAYYSGIICERRAKAHLKKGGPGAGRVAYDWLTKAMAAYDRALTSCDPGNQDAVLRWNACARIINANPSVKPDETDNTEMLLDSFERPH